MAGAASPRASSPLASHAKKTSAAESTASTSSSLTSPELSTGGLIAWSSPFSSPGAGATGSSVGFPFGFTANATLPGAFARADVGHKRQQQCNGSLATRPAPHT